MSVNLIPRGNPRPQLAPLQLFTTVVYIACSNPSAMYITPYNAFQNSM